MSADSELLELILNTAKFVASSKETQKYALDFSEKSIGRLDDMIDDFWGEDGPSEKNFSNVAWVLSCYIAAIIEKNFKGEWRKDEAMGAAVFHAESSGFGLYPYAWVDKRLELQDSLKSKYDTVKKLIKADRR